MTHLISNPDLQRAPGNATEVVGVSAYNFIGGHNDPESIPVED